MNWEAITGISEMVGAIGVIVTVAYLAFQIRQNTKQLKQNERTAIAAALSESAAFWRENRSAIYSNPEIADIFLKGIADPDSLDESELYRFRLLINNAMDSVWAMYLQTVITGFSGETWATQGVGMAKRVFTTPGGRWFWAQYQDNYPKEFRGEMDRILDSKPSAE